MRDQKATGLRRVRVAGRQGSSRCRKHVEIALADSGANLSGARMRIRLVGTTERRTIALEIERSVLDLLTYARLEVDPWQAPKARTGTRRELVALAARIEVLLRDFVAKSRGDLGTASEDDEGTKEVEADTSESEIAGED